jgi:hypothetical protein
MAQRAQPSFFASDNFYYCTQRARQVPPVSRPGRHGTCWIASRLREANRRRHREVGQDDPGGQHQGGITRPRHSGLFRQTSTLPPAPSGLSSEAIKHALTSRTGTWITSLPTGYFGRNLLQCSHLHNRHFNQDQAVDGGQVRRALRLQRLEVSDREDPFAAVIRCTADPAKADKRTRSKWSRVMRYAVAYKADSERLEQFIRRKGGINGCAARFSRSFERGLQ